MYKFVSKYELRNAVSIYIDDIKSGILIYGEINSWDVSSIKDFSYLFRRRVNFNEDISRWDVSSAQYMEYMFDGAKRFNIDLNIWDVSSVKSFKGMFENTNFKYRNLWGWCLDNASLNELRICKNSILSIHTYEDLTDKERKENKECPISMEVYKDKTRVIITECNHMFCVEALRIWLGSNNKCPLCRKEVSKISLKNFLNI